MSCSPCRRSYYLISFFACLNLLGYVGVGWYLGRPSLRIEPISPQIANADSAITLRFSQPMISSDRVGGQVGSPYLAISPETQGAFRWTGVHTLRFEPHHPLPNATAFTVTVSGQLPSLSGHTLGADRALTFHTPPLALLNIRQAGLSARNEATLELTFNDAVAPEDLASHLTLTADGKPVAFKRKTTTPGALIGPAPSPVPVLIETAPLAENAEKLVARLRRGLRGASGPLGLDADVVREAPLNPGLTIEDVDPWARARDQVSIRVETSRPINAKAAAAFVEIDPKVAFTVSSHWSGFSLHGAFVPGQRYRLRFLKGLPSQDGARLSRDSIRSAIIPDLEPAARFKTHGVYMAGRGGLLLPLETVNTRKVSLRVRQVYPDNVIHFLRDAEPRSFPDSLAREVLQTTLAAAGPRNEPRVENLDLRSLLGPQARGVYLAQAAPSERPAASARQLLMISDLGLTAKRSPTDLLVWVNTLSAAAPVAGARVQVFNKASQRVLDAVTDADGVAHFTRLPAPPEGEPFAVTATLDDDTAFLELRRAALDLAPFDASGRPWLRNGNEAFLFTSRGACRPGETVNIGAVVRGPDLATPAAFPVEFRVVRPDGRPVPSLNAALNKWGAAEAAIRLPAYAMTGRYRASLHLPGAEDSMGQCEFQVEDFIPNRLKASASADDRRFAAAERIPFSVAASHLFGQPAAGLDVDGRCEFRAAPFSSAALPGFVFDDPDAAFAPIQSPLGRVRADENGMARFDAAVPASAVPPAALQAVFFASVLETGGRSVTATVSRPVDVHARYVGLKRERDGLASPGAPETVLLALARPDGQPLPSGAALVRLLRVEWTSLLKEDTDGRFRFESERQEILVSEQTCEIKDGAGRATFALPAVGEYKVAALDKDGRARSALSLYCGGDGASARSMEHPDRVEVRFGKDEYAPGEEVAVLIRGPFAGRALVTVESDRVLLTRVLSMETPTAEARFTLDPGPAANLYCSVTLLRPVDSEARWTACRAFGVAPLRFSQAGRRLGVALQAPAEVRPGQRVEASVLVTSADGAPAQGQVTLAAVDEGICLLTRFVSPNPLDFFFGQRRLEVHTSDAYSMLMPEVGKPKIGADSTPGGDGGFEDERLFNPVAVERVKPVALWLGVQDTTPQGSASFSFDMPEFRGQLRLMAVAVEKDRFGAAQAPLLVRQPLMIQTSFPRFLAPGDEFEIPVAVFNNTPAGGKVKVALTAPEGVALGAASAEVEVAAGAEGLARFRAKAPDKPCALNIRAQALLGAESAGESVSLAVRPPAGLSRLCGGGVVAAGSQGAFTLPAGWVQGTDRFKLSFSALPSLRLAASLRFVVRYPYGCVEQTTSAVFPLLYLSDLAALADPETFQRAEVAEVVQAGVDRLLAMQTACGGFGYWPGASEVYPWGSVYATHFLVEARKAGYAVPEAVVQRAFDYLSSLLARSGAGEMSEKAYACMVLALAGKPNPSWPYRLHEERASLASGARCHVAAALTLAREPKLAAEMLGAVSAKTILGPQIGGALVTPVREDAILLSALIDADPASARVPELVRRVEAAQVNGRWATTQENAFALLALGKYLRMASAEPASFEAAVAIQGQPPAAATHAAPLVLSLDGAGGRAVNVDVRGQGRLYYHWQAEGVPVEPLAAEADHRLEARRRFLSRAGEPVAGARFRQGEVYVAEISLASDATLDNLVVSDLLPAGLEIENPRLATSDTAIPPPPGAEVLIPRHVEMRDDRLLVFTDCMPPGRRVYRYAVRAVTIGRFRLPPLAAEVMYDPSVSSLHGAGYVEVVAGR